MSKLTNDSDSSDGSEGDYADTGVLLGYASKSPTEDFVSQIGGIPGWLSPSSPPSASFAKCQNCNGLLVLLLQLNGNLPNRFPTHERRLFIFSCKKKACKRKKGSIKAFRSVRTSHINAEKLERDRTVSKSEAPRAQASNQPTKLGDSLFGISSTAPSSNSNPFSTSESPNSPKNPFSSSNTINGGPPTQKVLSLSKDSNPSTANTSSILPTFAEKMSIGNNDNPTPTSLANEKETWPAQDKFPPAYPKYFLDADFEILEKTAVGEVPQRIEIDQASSNPGEGGDDKEIFESSLDKTFQKFADQLAQNPEQILRYEFDGAPLLYSSQDSVGQLFSRPHSKSSKITTIQSSGSRIPRCVNCGSTRVFELQLTPYAIIELESEELGLEGMEWGTIIMGVCSRDCLPKELGAGEIGYLEEWVGVQWEEPVNKR